IARQPAAHPLIRQKRRALGDGLQSHWVAVVARDEASLAQACLGVLEHRLHHRGKRIETESGQLGLDGRLRQGGALVCLQRVQTLLEESTEGGPRLLIRFVVRRGFFTGLLRRDLLRGSSGGARGGFRRGVRGSGGPGRSAASGTRKNGAAGHEASEN